MIVGKNGAGKTTLLKAILGEIANTGSIRFSSMHTNSKVLTVGYVPQKLNIEDSPISVYDLVCSYTSNNPVMFGKNSKKYEEIKKHLEEFSVDNFIDEKISNLSGGELQRVLIAISTMPCPELLILDEPISGIDARGKREFYNTLEKLKNTHDISILLVSHDFEYVKRYADRVVLLNKKILKEGTPDTVLSSKEFLGEFGIGGANSGDNI